MIKSENLDFESDYGTEYDLLIRISLPNYDQLYPIIGSYLQAGMGSQDRLLVSGAGTGMELITFGRNHPQWKITGLDPSEQMIALAKDKVQKAKLEEKITIHQCFTHDLPIQPLYQGATSILVFPFLPSNEDKLFYLKSIADRLSSGAILILVTAYGDNTSSAFQRDISAWRTQALSRSQALGLPLVKIKQLLDVVLSQVHYTDESTIQELLHQADFHQTSLFFKTYHFGGWVAIKK